MTLVDIHSHMDFEHFDNDRDDIVSKMREGNIITLTNTLNRENYHYALSLFKDSSDVVKVLPGLYPTYAQEMPEGEFADYLQEIRGIRNLVAIGEVGLDLKHGSNDAEFEVQVDRFRSLIELAIELDKPIIVHSWGAEERVLDVIEEYVSQLGFRKFVIHCFTGKKKLIKRICELKIYASVPLTVLNTQGFQILVNELPVSKLLVETDSPYQHPGKERNSPLNIPLVYAKIAELKGYDKKEIENIIFRNYQRLFV
jgi:TatD DNase family protein